MNINNGFLIITDQSFAVNHLKLQEDYVTLPSVINPP